MVGNKSGSVLNHNTAYAKTKKSFQKKKLTFTETTITSADGETLIVLTSTDKRMPRLRAAFHEDGTMCSMDS